MNEKWLFCDFARQHENKDVFDVFSFVQALIPWQIDESKEHKSVYGIIILDSHENNVTRCIVYIENKSN